MKKLVSLIGILLLFFSCSSTRFVDSWKNEEITSFSPQKLLVIGMTDNLTARKIFEENMQKEFVMRNIIAEQGTSVIETNFTSAKKSEKEIDEMIMQLSKKGFDAIVITAVKGVDKRRNYYDNYNTFGYRWVRFGRYYYWYQDIYFRPDYYNEYTVYHVETSIYNINEDERKSLVWVGAIDLVDPQTISSTVKNYVSRIIEQLEYENLIKKRSI
jgi:hypothetical protein